MDFFLLGALVAYSGGGGVLNITLSNWARDKGYGMGSRVGHIGGMVGGERTQLADTGFIFEPDAANMSRWRGWWRIVRVDQWGIFFVGALLGMMLPALLYVTFITPGTEMKGLEIAAVLASDNRRGRRAGHGTRRGHAGRLDPVQDATRLRRRHDALGHRHPVDRQRARARWRGGDVRAVYYVVLAIVVIWGMIALRLAQPIVLLQIGANIGGRDLRDRRAAPAVSQHAGAAAGAAPAHVAARGPGGHGAVLWILHGPGGALADLSTRHRGRLNACG